MEPQLRRQKPQKQGAARWICTAHWEELQRIAERVRPCITGRIFFAVDFYQAAEYLTKAADIVWGAGDPQGAVHAAT